MGELIVTTFLSMDGVVQAPGGPEEDTSGGFTHGGWVAPLFDEGTGVAIDGFFRNADAFLFGRRTYDIFASYWPKITDPADRIAGALNELPKFVASRTRREFDWPTTTHVRDVASDVPEIVRRFPREVQVHGSGNLVQSLLKHGLVDELRILTFPVTIGSGKRLFGDGTIPGSWSLARSETTDAGIVIGVYRRAGDLRTGTVGD